MGFIAERQLVKLSVSTSIHIFKKSSCKISCHVVSSHMYQCMDTPTHPTWPHAHTHTHTPSPFPACTHTLTRSHQVSVGDYCCVRLSASPDSSSSDSPETVVYKRAQVEGLRDSPVRILRQVREGGAVGVVSSTYICRAP